MRQEQWSADEIWSKMGQNIHPSHIFLSMAAKIQPNKIWILSKSQVEKFHPFKTFHQKVTLRYSEPCNIFEKNMQKLVWFIKLIWDQIYQRYRKFKNGFLEKFSWLLIENRVPLICAIYIKVFSTISMEYFLPRIMDNISSCLGNLSAVDPLVRTAQDPTFFKHDSNANRNTISHENIPEK